MLITKMTDDIKKSIDGFGDKINVNDNLFKNV